MWQWLEGAISTPNIGQARVLLLIGMVVFATLILLMIATLVGSGQRSTTRKVDDGFNRRKFAHIAAGQGLGSADTVMLERLARRHGATDPTRLFTDKKLLADLLTRAIYAIEHRPDLPGHDRQLWLSRYYRLQELMEHADGSDSHRRYRLCLLERPCIVTPIRSVPRRQVAGSDLPALPPASMLAVERRTMATVMDVSTGGCSINSLGLFKSGCLIRLEFELNRHAPITTIGRILQVRPQGAGNSIMHLQFTKLSREHRNRIHRFVYDEKNARTTDKPGSRP